MGQPVLASDHIRAINSAMETHDGDYEKAAAHLNWNWNARKLYLAIEQNPVLASRWLCGNKDPGARDESIIVRPVTMDKEQIALARLPESDMERQLSELSVQERELEKLEPVLRELGITDEAAREAVVGAKLQHKHSIHTLLMLGGGCVKTFFDAKAAAKACTEQLDGLKWDDISSIEKQKTLRADRRAMLELANKTAELVMKTTTLRLEAERRAKEKKRGYGKPRMLGITAMAGSNVVVGMKNEGN